jgi:hypothetical protein
MVIINNDITIPCNKIYGTTYILSNFGVRYELYDINTDITTTYYFHDDFDPQDMDEVIYCATPRAHNFYYDIDSGTIKELKSFKIKSDLHREDGPALIRSDGLQEWWYNGIVHRIDGPAIIRPDGSSCYYIKGHRVSKKTHSMLSNFYK